MEKEYSSWEELQKDIALYIEVGDIIYYCRYTFEIGSIREPLKGMGPMPNGYFIIDRVEGNSSFYCSINMMEDGEEDGTFKNITRIRNKNLEVFDLIED